MTSGSRDTSDEVPGTSPPSPPETDAAARTTGRSVIGGGAWTGLRHMLPQLNTLVLSVVAARFLGPTGMGRQSFIAFVALSVTMLLTGGLPISLARYVSETMGARRPPAVRGLVQWAWRLELLAAIAGFAILAVTAATRPNLTAAWVLAGVGSAMGILHTVPSSVLVGLQRWREVAIVSLTTGVIGTATTVAVLAAGGGITGMFAVEVAVSAVNLAWATHLARGALGDLSPTVERDPELRRRTRSYAGWTTAGVVLSFVVWRRSEFFFLERYASPAEIAFYSVAFAGVTALMQFVEAVGSVVAPAFATLFGAGAVDRIRSGFARSVRLLSLVVLPLTAAALALGPSAITVLYGDEYSRAGTVLMVLMLPFPVIAARTLSGALLFGIGQVKLPLAAGAVATVVDVALAILLVPVHGAVGAAFASAGAQTVAAALNMGIALRATGRVSVAAGRAVRTGVAAAAAGGVAHLAALSLGGGVGLTAGAAAGLAVFVPAAMLLRIVPAEDSEWLEETVERFGPAAQAAVRRISQVPA